MSNIFSDNNFREQSEFDMSFSYLYRLNNIIYVIDESSLQLNFWKWFHSLMVLYREVSTELRGDVNSILSKKKEKNEDLKNEFLVVEGMISKIEPYISKYKTRGNNGINQQMYKELHVLDIYLRQILKKSGLLVKMRQDPRFGLGQI